MIDLRYHLASVVAIFFALGLGMLIGAQLADEGTLAQEHTRLIEQIEASVERVRADNRRLSDELTDTRARLAAEQAFVDGMLDEVVQNRLGGVPVDIVATAGASSYADRVHTALRQAGAAVSMWDDTLVTNGKQRSALTLFLWGEADEPDIRSRASGERESETAPGEGADIVGEQLLQPNASTGGTVWGWPGAAASRREMPTVDGVRSVEAVDTPKGLLALIDILRAEAGIMSAGADGNQ